MAFFMLRPEDKIGKLNLFLPKLSNQVIMILIGMRCLILLCFCFFSRLLIASITESN